ncbi:DUF6378 domain-containing protein [uncultured Amphritea sp.]|uniref:DUF6378 domain-containing protein n=1 Tax=uncultured Amphritea sp. TaxID=981605 RepID=UPI0026073988|nr:DUF6378 domain-containing protein [uncultured Amphritea sp.]
MTNGIYLCSIECADKHFKSSEAEATPDGIDQHEPGAKLNVSFIEKSPVKPSEVLMAGAKHMEDRSVTYDKPDGERSMEATVNAFNAVTGNLLTEEQGWLLMALLKMVRSQQGMFKLDNYEDGAAYFALAAEAGANERDPAGACQS